MLMRLAFLVDRPSRVVITWFLAVWAKMGSQRRRWERMWSLYTAYPLESMRALLEALLYSAKKPRTEHGA